MRIIDKFMGIAQKIMLEFRNIITTPLPIARAILKMTAQAYAIANPSLTCTFCLPLIQLYSYLELECILHLISTLILMFCCH